MQCGKIFRYRFHSRQWCFVGKSKRAEGGGFRVVTDYTPPSEPISSFGSTTVFLKGLKDFLKSNMSHLLLLGKFEYGGGPIFKVVLEC